MNKPLTTVVNDVNIALAAVRRVPIDEAKRLVEALQSTLGNDSKVIQLMDGFATFRCLVDALDDEAEPDLIPSEAPETDASAPGLHIHALKENAVAAHRETVRQRLSVMTGGRAE